MSSASRIVLVFEERLCSSCPNWFGLLRIILAEPHCAHHADSARDNTILLHTGLSAHTHAASHELDTRPGWWEKFIGPGRALDTDKYFVVCVNVLGSCYGSTGPWSVNPKTGRPYGTDFPAITVEDMVRSQFQLLEGMGVHKVCTGNPAFYEWIGRDQCSLTLWAWAVHQK
jgi:homoserine O-acetyltransferase